MREETVRVPGSGGRTLSARRTLPPDGRVRAAALFAHGFGPAADPEPARHISRALTQAGVAVVRLGFVGPGEREAEGSGSATAPDSSTASGTDDLVTAATWMDETLQAPALLVGHSLAGAAVLAAAARIPSCRAVAAIGAPFAPGPSLPDVEGGRMDAVLADLKRPLAIFHSPVDEVVEIGDAAKLYTAAHPPKSFVSLDDADHHLTDERDAVYVGDVLAAWVSRYLEPREERAHSEQELVREPQVSARTGADGFLTEILARGHALLADEPAAVGGTDLGPTPYDLLAAALGACTTMTLRMYADRKEWPLEEASVRLRHRKIHARDDEAVCEGREARLDALEREVRLEGPLDAEQRARLMEIADRCPVHRTLDRGVVIDTWAHGAEPPGR